MSTERVVCAVCGKDGARPYRRGMYRLEGTSFDLVRCPCGMVYVNPRPDAASLAALYADPDYYTTGYNLGVETQNYFERQDELLELYGRTMAELERAGCAIGDMLELGSAGGFLLEAARRRGWRVKGVELAPQAVAFSRERLGLEIHAGDLFEAPYPDGSFDLVVADNVLEHTTDPARILAKLHALLRQGGKLVVVVPSYVNSPYFRALSALRGLVPRRVLGPGLLRILKLETGAAGSAGVPPYHILEFDRRTLTRLVRSAGFEPVRVSGRVPLPAELFKAKRATARVRLLRAVFRSLQLCMKLGLAPGAQVHLLARKA
jgi:SAM-dependent methyltransferase